MKQLFPLIVFLSFICSHLSLVGQNPFQKIYVFKIHEEIAPPAVKTTRDALEMADSNHADLLIVDLDTYGGMVDAADEIRTLLLNAKMPVWAFIENNAASAGAFISLACDSIYMKPGSTIGASTVVNQEGEKVGEKYQSFMRSRMRSTAEQNGRNPDIAEAMVEAQKTIPGVVDSGRVVSLTVKEAIQLGFCEGEFSSIEALLDYYQIKDYKLYQHNESLITHIVKFFMRPYISGLLITAIVLGIFFELKTPGIGFPTMVAVLAAILYFVPLYLEGLAAYWEIALFAVGIVLLIIEIFFIPGFGIVGVLGASFVFFSLVLALVKAVPNTGPIPLPNTESLLKAVLTVIISMFSAFAVILIFGRSALHSRMFKRVEVKTVQTKTKGYVANVMLSQAMIGKEGTALSNLRPGGNIEIENDIYEALAVIGFIERGSTVRVTGIDNFILLVEQV